MNINDYYKKLENLETKMELYNPTIITGKTPKKYIKYPNYIDPEVFYDFLNLMLTESYKSLTLELSEDHLYWLISFGDEIEEEKNV